MSPTYRYSCESTIFSSSSLPFRHAPAAFLISGRSDSELGLETFAEIEGVVHSYLPRHLGYGDRIGLSQ